MSVKYLKWLNLLPLIIFFIVDKLRGTLISRYLLITIIILGVLNMCLAKGMKEYLFFSLLLVLSTTGGVVLYTLYYYNFVSADFETPIVGVFVMLLYGVLAAVVAAVGMVVVVIKDRIAEKRVSKGLDTCI